MSDPNNVNLDRGCTCDLEPNFRAEETTWHHGDVVVLTQWEVLDAEQEVVAQCTTVGAAKLVAAALNYYDDKHAYCCPLHSGGPQYGADR